MKRKQKQKINWLGNDVIMKDKGNSFGLLVGNIKALPRYKSPSFLSSPKSKSKIESQWFDKSLKSKKPTSSIFNNIISSSKKNRRESISFMRPVQVNTFLRPSKSKQVSIMTAEELLYGKKNLRKYGDKDMDGSPNRWDCSPGRVNQDGPVAWLKKKMGLSKPEGWKKRKPSTEITEEPVQQLIQERIIAKEKREELSRLKKEVKATTGKEVTDPEARKLKKAQEVKERVAEAKEKAKDIAQFEEGGRFYGKAGKIKQTEETLAAKIERGEKPSTAELKKLYEAKEKYKQTNILAALKAGELPSAKAIKTTLKAAEWSPEASSFGRRTSAMAAGVLGAFLPPGTISGRPPRSSGAGAGRPKGSFKYYIPGQGNVDVYTYRKWARKQRAVQRLQGQLPEQSPEYQMQQQLQQQAQQLEPAKAGLNDQGNYDSSKYNAPQVYDTANLPPDQARDMKSREQAYQRVMLNKQYDQAVGQLQVAEQQQPPLAVKAVQPQFKDMRQVAQYQAQVQDNVLNAPIVQRGDMVGTGTNVFTYTSPEANILNAPNITMGQMRNINNEKEVPSVRLSEKPIPNPYGDQYTEIDPMSGKVVLKKRISEKFMTGEAY